MTPPLRVDSPRARLEARQRLRDHGIGSHIDGEVLWIFDSDGRRERCDDGDWLVYGDGVFTVRRDEGAGL